MRAGKTIDHCNVADVTEADISRMMVGRDIVMEIDKEKNTLGETVLSVQHVTKYILGTKKILDDVSFRIRRGEILGRCRCGRQRPEGDQRNYYRPGPGF